ncbi:MAG: patatin-like phospholipase family protein [Kosmotoga sp.]|nr:MAG: patatin-like phospholipase family protein [Kosmotoga sp.]
MKISFGGNSVLYFSITGAFKAFQEEDIGFDEVHCAGFSCVPAFLTMYYDSPDRAFNIVRKVWKDFKKSFYNPEGHALPGIVEILRTLYKIGDPMRGALSHKALRDFTDEYFPGVKLSEIPELKIHAFNISEYRDEIMECDVRTAMNRTLAFPVQFAPYDNYISGSSLYGVPEGELLYILNHENRVKPRHALDYLFLSTKARTHEIVNIKKKRCNYVFEEYYDDSNPDNLVTKIYHDTKNWIKKNIQTS